MMLHPPRARSVLHRKLAEDSREAQVREADDAYLDRVKEMDDAYDARVREMDGGYGVGQLLEGLRIVLRRPS